MEENTCECETCNAVFVWMSARFLRLLRSTTTQVHCGRGPSIGKKRQPKKEKEDEEELYGHSREPGNDDSGGNVEKPDGLHCGNTFPNHLYQARRHTGI